MPSGPKAPDDLRAYRSMLSTFKKWKLVAPRVPTHLIPRLVEEEGVHFSTRGVDIDPIAGYGLELAQDESGNEPEYLSDTGSDFFVASGRDNGYSTMWGFAARAGGLFVSIQSVVGDWNSDSSHMEQVDRCHSAFNAHLAPLMDRGFRPLAVAVVVSSYRNDAHVLSTERGSWMSGEYGRVVRAPLAGWGCVANLIPGYQEAAGTRRRDLESDLEMGRFDSSPDLEAAIQFLLEVTPTSSSREEA